MFALFKLSAFLFKPFSAMVFQLLGYVLAHGRPIRFGDGKSTVARLPGKPLKIPPLRFNPIRGRLFDILD